MPRYRRSMSDRLGPDASTIIRSVGFAITMSPLGAVAGAALGIKLGLGGTNVVISAFAGAVIGAAMIYFVIWVIPATGGAAMQAALMPSGNTTPYETDFSYESALAMKGDLKSALESFEEKMAGNPTDSTVRLRAAEMYLTAANYDRARELYREVQRIPEVDGHDDVVASYRLIDLYRGKLADPMKSLPEFRRLIERYPNSQVERNAREALASLKKEMSFD